MQLANNFNPNSRRSLTHGLRLVDGQDVIQIPTHDFIQSASFEISGGGAWKGSLVLFDPSGERLHPLFATMGSSEKIHFWWDWMVEGQRANLTAPTYRGIIIKPAIQCTPQGNTMTLELMGDHILGVFDTLAKPRWFKPDASIHAIVEEIAKTHRWTVKTINGHSTIQPTSNVIPEKGKTVLERTETHFDYIRNTCLKYAVAKDKTFEGEFRAWFDTDDVFHFATAAYYRKYSNRGVPRVAFRFGNDPMGNVISFEITDDEYLLRLRGANGNSQYTGVDSKKGTAPKIEQTADGVQTEATQRHTPLHNLSETERYVTQPAIYQRNAIPLFTRSSEALRIEAAKRLQAQAFEGVKASMSMIGTHQFQLLDKIEVDYRYASGSQHFLSGQYQVTGITHELAGTWTTDLELVRMGHTNAPHAKQKRQGSKEFHQLRKGKRTYKELAG